MGGDLRGLWAEGKTAFGAWIMLSGPAGAEMVATMGFDYVGIDCQHGLLGVEDMRDILFAIKGTAATPIVRVPANDPAWIGKALDAGAQGIIVPLVNTPEEALGAAQSCRFPPEGRRSFGLARGHQPLGRDPAEVNRQVLCFPMIETREGLGAASAICSAPGVDGIYIGPSDLALSLGMPPGGEQSPEHGEAVERIRRACSDARIIPAIHAQNGAEARARAEQGFRMVTVTADAALLAIGSLTELGNARA